jgi:lipopolysaccharide export system permease protein
VVQPAGRPLERPMRLLDRYIVGQFARIFLVCVLGVPFLFQVIDLTDNLDDYLAEGATQAEVALYYVYQFPYHVLLGFPLAALLASVFTVSTLARHFETTAVKAGGVSFYRFTAPVLIAALALSGVALGLTQIVPTSVRKAEEVLGRQQTRSRTLRVSFVYRGNEGRVYGVRRLDTQTGTLSEVAIDREGTGPDYPTYTVTAPSARWDSVTSSWVVENGRLHILPEVGKALTFEFAELRQRHFTETPEELLARPPTEEEMTYGELGRYINALERSGTDASRLRTVRAIRLSFPFAVLIIVLFGTPLAHSTRRGGAPMSVGIALATTIVFMIVIRISEAIGAGGGLHPSLAAWIPNLLFLTAGIVLMAKVRT